MNKKTDPKAQFSTGFPKKSASLTKSQFSQAEKAKIKPNAFKKIPLETT